MSSLPAQYSSNHSYIQVFLAVTDEPIASTSTLRGDSPAINDELEATIFEDDLGLQEYQMEDIIPEVIAPLRPAYIPTIICEGPNIYDNIWALTYTPRSFDV